MAPNATEALRAINFTRFCFLPPIWNLHQISHVAGFFTAQSLVNSPFSRQHVQYPAKYSNSLNPQKRENPPRNFLFFFNAAARKKTVIAFKGITWKKKPVKHNWNTR